MYSQMIRRSFALLLALILVCTQFPSLVRATESADSQAPSEESIPASQTGNTELAGTDFESTLEQGEDTPANESTVSSEASSDGDIFQKIVIAAEVYMETYQFSAGMTDEELLNAYLILDSAQSEAAWNDAWAIDAMASGLSESELEELRQNKNIQTIARVVNLIEDSMVPVVIAGPYTAGSVTITEKLSGSATSSKYKDGVYTAEATSKSPTFLSFGGKDGEITTTLTNNSGAKGTLSFSWNVASSAKPDNMTIAGSTVTANSGGESFFLEDGKSVQLYLKKGQTGEKITLIIENILFEESVDSKVTVSYNELGTVTRDGATVTSGTVHEISAGTEVTYVAAATGKNQFLGWVDTNSYDASTQSYTLLSRSASYSFSPSGDRSITAVFISETETTPYFYASSYTKLAAGLGNAVSCAGSGTIILANNATLTESCTIPANITVLIPFDSGHTSYTTTPEGVHAYTTPTMFRTLTMASGSSLNVLGTLSLPAKINAAHGGAVAAGAPIGPVSCIKMEDNSSITLDGGTLYAWGFITGSGTITAKNKASVYEAFQFQDFLGGSQTADMKNKVFPLRQYYVQNIEVALTLDSTSKLSCCSAVFMRTLSSILSQTVVYLPLDFIGTDTSLFRLTDGTVTKQYDGSTDRLLLTLDGDATISSMALSVDVTSVNSKDYVLPLNGNISITITDNSTASINQSLALLPGAEINIGNSAKLSVTDSAEVFVYDSDQWGGFCGTGNKKFIPISYAPGKKYNRTDSDLKDVSIKINGTLDISAGKLYTTNGGANIFSTNEQPGTVIIPTKLSTTTYQHVHEGNYTPIAANSAQLKNGDGSYTHSNKAAASSTVTYTYANDKWSCGACTAGAEVRENEKPATCVATGSYEAVTYCTTCGAELGREKKTIPATGHTEVIDVAVTPTCTTTGLTEGSHCSVCGEVFVAQTTIAALGHTEVTDNAVAPTCTETGLTEGTHCSVCNAILIAQTEVPATGHSYTSQMTTAPTCTEAGVKTFTCSKCNDSYTEAVDATGHTEVVDNAVAPTCTGTGLTEGSHCSVCGAVIKKQEVVDATGHSYDNGVITTDPTCTGKGIKTFTCANDTSHTYTEEVEATGHREVFVEGKAATCVDAGNIAYYKCSVCEKKFQEEACENELSDEQIVIPATGIHDQDVSISGNPATYDDDGLTEGKKCSVCDEITVQQEKIPMLRMLKSYGKTLLFEDIIRINFYFSKLNAALTDEQLKTDAGMLVWKNPVASGVYDHTTFNAAKAANADSVYEVLGLTPNGNYYTAESHGIPAKNMVDTVYACAYVKVDGKYYYSKMTQYSPLLYAENRIVNSKDENFKKLMVALMNYGYAAQVNFKNYKIETPMNAALSDEQKNWSYSADLLVGKIGYENLALEGFTPSTDNLISVYGLSLTYDGAIEVNMYNSFSPTLISGEHEKGLLYWVEDTYIRDGNKLKLSSATTVDQLTYKGKETKNESETWETYSGTIEGMAAKRMKKTYFACAYVKDSSGNMHYGPIRSYSAHDYANSIIGNDDKHSPEMQNLCRTMIIYGNAAETYFTSKEGS